MAIRYLIGDALFNELIKFRNGEFILTQVYYEFVSSLKSSGNLLYPFYDNPPDGITTDTLQHETRIRTRTVFQSRNISYRTSRRRGTLTQWGWRAVLIFVGV